MIARNILLPRRQFVVGGVAALLVGSASESRQVGVHARAQIEQLERQLGGRIGVCALDTGSGARLAHREGERFALCSTFKWLLAAAVLARAELDPALLDHRLPYGPADLFEVSPVTRLHLSEGALPIRVLCQAAIEVSDNTAANLVLKFIGGPAALTTYLRQMGDPVTRLDRFELSLNSNLPEDIRDTTTPAAMIATMRRILLADALSAGSRQVLIGWLKNCQTGLHRLRAGLPSTWTVGDKTGTGENGAANDDAIIWPPQRSPILIAAFLSDSQASADALNAAHARLGHIIAATLS